eukprot:scaffold15938_cov92-Isochrysis_galbana.AAC.3
MPAGAAFPRGKRGRMHKKTNPECRPRKRGCSRGERLAQCNPHMCNPQQPARLEERQCRAAKRRAVPGGRTGESVRRRGCRRAPLGPRSLSRPAWPAGRA